jgi:hypothetical protein
MDGCPSLHGRVVAVWVRVWAPLQPLSFPVRNPADLDRLRLRVDHGDQHQPTDRTASGVNPVIVSG